MNRRVKWMLLAAVAAVPLLWGGRADAQYRIANDGRALDANPRRDSGGFNSGTYMQDWQYRGSSWNLGNMGVTGNVTGGREFRGPVPYSDPRAFRGPVAGEGTDRFLRWTRGPMAPYQPQQYNYASQPFYGRSLASPPPPGFQQQGFTGTYTQSSPRDLSDTQLSRHISQRPVDRMMLQGNVLDARAGEPEIGEVTGPRAAMSPTDLRPRSWDFSDRTFANPWLTNQPGGMVRPSLDFSTIQRMRDELNRSALDDDEQPPTSPGLISGRLPQPFDAPETGPLRTQLNRNPLTNEIGQQQSYKSIAPPSQQSTQYAELERRLHRYYIERAQGDAAGNKSLLDQLERPQGSNRLPGAKPDDQPGVKQPGASLFPPGPALGPGSAVATPKADVPDYARIGQELARQPATHPVDKPQPTQVKSLATGVKAQDLANVLVTAETLMKEGKFSSAISEYEAAGQVAPNNRLVLLGQANAELGAGYYARAEEHLRHALSTDPALALAQFDLKGMIGQQRLETVVKEIKATAAKQEDDAGLVLLLAYIAYNTQNEELAGVYLDLAEKRSEGNDPLFRLLRMHWKLPGDLKQK